MSGTTLPYGPGMGPDAPPVYIDPITGVPMPAPWQAQQPPAAPPAAPPPAPLQVSLPPAALPFSGPQQGPGDAPQAPPPQQTPDAASLPTPPVPPPADTIGSPTIRAALGGLKDAPPTTSDAPSGDVSNNRRNNPLNLRFANQDGAANDGGFAAFPTQEAGLDAARHQFSINSSRGINTLSGLISSWAPKNENDTDAYIKTVSGITGIAPDAKIDLTDPSVQAKLIPAMSLVENGPAGKSGAGAPPPPPAAAPPAAEVPPPTPAYMAAQGFPTISPNAYAGGPGDQLLAIGAGLSGAPSLGKGMAAVGSNVLALGQNNRDALIKQAQYGLENRRLEQQIGFQNASLGLRGAALDNTVKHQGAQIDNANQRLQLLMQPKPTGVTTKGPDGNLLQEFRDPATGDTTYRPMEGTTTRQQSVDLRAKQQSGQPALIQSAIKDNQKRANEIDAEGEQSITQLPQLANFRALLDSGQTGAGATAVDQFKRYIANRLGIQIGDTTPASANLAQALSSQLVNGQVSSSMRGLGLRSNNEFNTFKEGMTGLDKNPDTLKQMIDTMQKGAEHNRDVFYSWHSPDTEAQRDKIMLTPGGLSNWEAPLTKQYAASRGVGPSGPSAPTMQQDASGTWKPTTAALPGGGGQITIQRVQ